MRISNDRSGGNGSRPGWGQKGPVPLGIYPVDVFDVTSREPKAGGEPMIKVVFKITEGDQKNQKLYAYFSINHANPVVRDIALAQISELADACGLDGDDFDADWLYGKSCKVKVGVSDDGKWNVIKGYLDLQGRTVRRDPDDDTLHGTDEANAPPATNARSGKGGELDDDIPF